MIAEQLDVSFWIEELESDEINDGGLTVERYTKLFSAYIYTNELCAAKFLWRRVPEAMKADTELQRVWLIGKALWTKQYMQAYELIDYNWSDMLKPIMTEIKVRLQQDMLKCISMHYENIKFEQFKMLMGADDLQAQKILNIEGWSCEDGYVFPMAINEPEVTQNGGGQEVLDRLITLSSFTSYIEN